MPTIFPTLRYFRLISVYSLTLNMFYNNIFIVSLMMSLHSEPRKAVSFMQAFVSRRRLIFDPLLGLNNSQGSLLFAPEGNLGSLERDYTLPGGNFGSLERDHLFLDGKFGPLERDFSLSEGNFAFHERDYSLAVGGMTPDKVLISRHGEHVQLHKTLIKHSIALRSSHTISGSLE